MSNRTDFVAGFILGGLLGTALALLFAPRSGEEVRERLAGSAEDLRERARERADEVIRKLRVTAEDLAQRGRSKLDEGTARVREAVERGRETLEERAQALRMEDEGQPGE